MSRIAVAALLVALGSCGDEAAPGGGGSDSATSGESDSSATDVATGGSATSDGSAEGTGSTGSDTHCPPTPGTLTDALLVRDTPWEGTLGPCEMKLVPFALPQNAVAEIAFVASGEGMQAAITWPDDPNANGPLDEAIDSLDASGEFVFVAPRSGEFFVAVFREMPQPTDESVPFSLSLRCISGCERHSTRFPIALVHGWTGWDAIGPLEYFFGVEDDLLGAGYPVAVATLDPYNHIDVRSVQLAEFVDETLEQQRARKVNLIAHSQGGLDSRSLISTHGYGDRVGQLITISTPHQGTPLGDIALGLQPSPFDDALYVILNLLGATGNFQSDAEASLLALSETYVQGTFNPANPDDPRVAYESWAGRTCMNIFECDDLCDVPIQPTHQMLNVLSGANDGIVPVDSALWGEYRGEMAADHFDEIGQVAGVTGPGFDHRAFYLDRAAELADGGY